MLHWQKGVEGAECPCLQHTYICLPAPTLSPFAHTEMKCRHISLSPAPHTSICFCAVSWWPWCSTLSLVSQRQCAERHFQHLLLNASQLLVNLKYNSHMQALSLSFCVFVWEKERWQESESGRVSWRRPSGALIRPPDRALGLRNVELSSMEMKGVMSAW